MNFQIASDLHLDTRGGLYGAEDSAYPVRKAPILVLAGDMASAMDPDYQELLARVAEPFDMVLYVPGNHEYYGSYISTRKMDERIEEICYSVGNVVYMNKRRINIRGIAYIGATLWTDCPNDDRYMNDFSHIDGGKFTPSLENRIHRDHRDWIGSAIRSAKREGCSGAVVVTHHAPDRALEMDTISRDPHVFPWYYASDMGRLTHDPFVQVWVHGHTHEAYRMQIDEGGTIFASNALGYRSESTGYSNNAVMKLGLDY
jgi:predicted MPP superfamily phosphohydrolase